MSCAQHAKMAALRRDVDPAYAAHDTIAAPIKSCG